MECAGNRTTQTTTRSPSTSAERQFSYLTKIIDIRWQKHVSYCFFENVMNVMSVIEFIKRDFFQSAERKSNFGIPTNFPSEQTFQLEVRDRFGELNNSSDPASVHLDNERLTIDWFRSGLRHRCVDGPAHLVFDRKSGICLREAWFKGGRLHRIGGPAIVLRNPNDSEVRGLFCYRDGQSKGLRALPMETYAKWFGLTT